MPEDIDTRRILPRLQHRRRRILRACTNCGRRTTSTRCQQCGPSGPSYGSDHQARRAALLPAAIGQPCPICAQTMTRHDKLDLDHDTNAITHASCNRANGAAKVNGGVVQVATRIRPDSATFPRVKPYGEVAA